MDLTRIEAVILVGGQGTRLRSAVPDKAKPLAQVGDDPFLKHLIAWLKETGIEKIILAIGYKADQFPPFIESLGDLGKGVILSEETEPLGTGGALRQAIKHCGSDTVLALNGDSFMDLDIQTFADQHKRSQKPVSLVVYEVEDVSRYGSVEIGDDASIVSFNEKQGIKKPGKISAGVYLFSKEILETLPEGKNISLEKDVFPTLTNGRLGSFETQGRFIDIGTPETYAKAAQVLNLDQGGRS